MNPVRPELRRAILHWREAIAAAGVVLAGIWMISLGGLLLQGLGLAVVVIGSAYLWVAVRRGRFRSGRGGPGVVQLDEGQIRYFGPFHGGSVALVALHSIRLVTEAGGRARWQLIDDEGRSLLIPADAEGSRLLFDAFAALEGMDAARLVALSRQTGPGTREIWQRPDGRLRPGTGTGSVTGGVAGAGNSGRNGGPATRLH